MSEKYLKIFITVAVLLVVAVNNNVTEYLTDKGYPAPLMMISYGLVALIINCIVGAFLKKRIFPKQWRFQMMRLINNGVSCLLIYQSFKYLSAGSVSLIQRTDIPFVIMLSFLIGYKRSSMQFWLSVWTVLTIIFMIVDAKLLDEEPIGFVLAFCGVILLSASYILVQKSATVESVFTLSNVNSIGMIVIGITSMIANNYSWHISTQHLWIFFLGGVMLFCIYVVAVRLYIWYKPERARFPFILGALATAIIEMVVERKVYPATQIALIILISGMIMTISLNAPTPRFFYGIFKKIRKSFAGNLMLNSSNQGV